MWFYNASRELANQNRYSKRAVTENEESSEQIACTKNNMRVESPTNFSKSQTTQFTRTEQAPVMPTYTTRAHDFNFTNSARPQSLAPSPRTVQTGSPQTSVDSRAQTLIPPTLQPVNLPLPKPTAQEIAIEASMNDGGWWLSDGVAPTTLPDIMNEMTQNAQQARAQQSYTQQSRMQPRASRTQQLGAQLDTQQLHDTQRQGARRLDDTQQLRDTEQSYAQQLRTQPLNARQSDMLQSNMQQSRTQTMQPEKTPHAVG